METKIFFWKYKGPIERVKTKILTKLIIRQSENQKKSFRIFFYKKSERENGQSFKSFRWNTCIHKVLILSTLSGENLSQNKLLTVKHELTPLYPLTPVLQEPSLRIIYIISLIRIIHNEITVLKHVQVIQYYACILF